MCMMDNYHDVQSNYLTKYWLETNYTYVCMMDNYPQEHPYKHYVNTCMHTCGQDH